VPQEAHIPSPQAPVITSQLGQLAAPQPARVSPLTLVKPPGLNQSQTSYPSAPNSQLAASPYAYQSSSAYRQHFESDDSTTSPRNSTQTSPAGAFKKQRGKGKKPGRLAKADPNPTLHRLSLISSPNQYHRHNSLHSLPCNPRVLARTSYHQTLRSSLSRDKPIIRSLHLPNLQLCNIVGMVYLLPLSSELRPLAGMPDLEETTKTCVA
jgi:hypothetical protein